MFEKKAISCGGRAKRRRDFELRRALFATCNTTAHNRECGAARRAKSPVNQVRWASWLLLSSATLWVLVAAVAEAQSSSQRQRKPTRVTVAWKNVSLDSVVGRLQAEGLAQLFVDRRVDPSQKIDFSAKDLDVSDLVDKLAASVDLQAHPIIGGYYLLPPARVASFQTLLEEQRRLVRTLPRTVSRSLLRRKRVRWERLQTPRQVVTDLVAASGLTLRNPEAIPHDLWDGNQLGPLPPCDALTIVLYGFDLSFQVIGQQVSVVPIELAGSEAVEISSN